LPVLSMTRNSLIKAAGCLFSGSSSCDMLIISICEMIN
jgi:hypothetical protein